MSTCSCGLKIFNSTKKSDVSLIHSRLGSFSDTFNDMKVDETFTTSINTRATNLICFRKLKTRSKFECTIFSHGVICSCYQIGYIYIYDLGKSKVFRFEPSEDGKEFSTKKIELFIR